MWILIKNQWYPPEIKKGNDGHSRSVRLKSDGGSEFCRVRRKIWFRTPAVKSTKKHYFYKYARAAASSYLNYNRLKTPRVKFQGMIGLVLRCKFPNRILYKARGSRDWKKRPRVDFFFSLTLGGLTNYVIRHTSIYGNVTSFAVTSSAVHTTKDVVPHLF